MTGQVIRYQLIAYLKNNKNNQVKAEVIPPFFCSFSKESRQAMKKEYSNLANKKVLIVDDDEILRQLMISEMIYYGINCVGAANSKEAFLIINSKDIDIVVSDMNMPGGSALDLLDNLKRAKLSKNPKIILMSGFSDLSKSEAKNMGVDEIMSKPFGVTELLETMSVVLG